MTNPPQTKRLPLFFAWLSGWHALTRFLTRLNVAFYRFSGGRITGKINDSPICLLTLTLRKSGTRKTIALMYTAHGDNVLLVASLGGADINPQWYYNLKAKPEIEIEVGDLKRKMVAHEAGVEERTILWPIVVASYPAFANYQRKTSRQIPVMVCEPAP